MDQNPILVETLEALNK